MSIQGGGGGGCIKRAGTCYVQHDNLLSVFHVLQFRNPPKTRQELFGAKIERSDTKLSEDGHKTTHLIKPGPLSRDGMDGKGKEGWGGAGQAVAALFISSTS